MNPALPTSGSTMIAASGCSMRDRAHGGRVVERRGERERCERLRNAGRVRKPERGDAGAGAHEERIRVTVIAAIELEKGIASRRRAREAQRAHCRLGAARHEAHHLDVRESLGDQLRELDLELGGDAEARALVHRLFERVEHHRCGVAEDERAPREDEVEIFVVIDVPDAGALTACDDERIATDTAERAHRRADAAGHDLARTSDDGGRLGAHRP